MKKLLLSFTLVLCVCLLSGCGKTLSCSLETEENEITSKVAYTVKFKGDEASKIKANMYMNMPDEYKDYMSTYEETMKAALKDKKGIDFDIKVKDTEITIDFVMEPKKMDKDALDVMDFDAEDFKGDYKTLKSQMEKEGYTCK